MTYTKKILLIPAALCVMVALVQMLISHWAKAPDALTVNPDVVAQESIKDEALPAMEPVISQAELDHYVDNVVDDVEAQVLKQQLPASLRDVPLPAALGVDNQGHLQVDMRVRNLFEFYLTAMGEESLENIVKRIHISLNALQEPALSEARELLQGYLSYRNHMAVLKNDWQQALAGTSEYDVTQIRELKEQVIRSRQSFLSDDAINAFFQREDEYDRYMMGRIAIAQDKSISLVDKQQQLALMDEQAPEWIREQQREATLVSVMRAQEKAMKNKSASAQEIEQLRIDTYGSEATIRLAELDEKRAVWQGRVDSYHQALLQLRQAYNGVPPQTEIEQLRAAHFNAREIIRIRGLEKSWSS